jgi:hypothetical protein
METLRGYEGLLRRRQKIMEQVVRDRDTRVEQLLHEVTASKKELNNARERVLEQEKIVVGLRMDIARKAFAHGMTQVDLQSKVEEQEVTIKHLLEQRMKQQKLVDEARIRLGNHDMVVSALKSRIQEQELLISDLRRRIEQQASNDRRRSKQQQQQQQQQQPIVTAGGSPSQAQEFVASALSVTPSLTSAPSSLLPVQPRKSQPVPTVEQKREAT